MGLSPGKIYKKCLAQAKDDRHADEIIKGANAEDSNIRYLDFRDVILAFYGQDYGHTKALHYIEEWEHLRLCKRRDDGRTRTLIGFDLSVKL